MREHRGEILVVSTRMSLARSALRLCHAPSRAFSSGAGSEKIAMVGSGNFGSALVRILCVLTGLMMHE